MMIASKFQHNMAMDVAEMKVKAATAQGKIDQQNKMTQIGATGAEARKTQAAKPKLPAAEVQMYNVWKEENKEGTVEGFMSLSQGDKETALKKNTAFLSRALGVSEKEAATRLIQNKADSPSGLYTKILMDVYRREGDEERATEIADNIFQRVTGKPFKEKPVTQAEQGVPGLTGKKPGMYKAKSGNIVEWDGSRVIRVRRKIP
jgi:hypothetical protein